jgi:hypothetical protein
MGGELLKMTAANDDELMAIELEQSDQLKQTQILNHGTFYTTNNTISLLLNHKYDQKNIVVAIDVKDWNKSKEVFKSELNDRGIKKQHISMLVDLLDENHHVIMTKCKGKGKDEGSKETTAQIALSLVSDKCSSLFLDQFGTPYATIEVGQGQGQGDYDHVETIKLNSSRFRNWLSKIFYSSEGKILTSDNANNVLSVLKARAEFDSGDRRDLYLTVASIPQDPNTIYYDLANSHWEYIKITPQGWSVVQASKITPVMFKRYPNQQPQIYPANDSAYSDDIYDKFLTLFNVKGEDKDNKLLLKCYIISLFYPEIPKPVLMLHGEQGSAKSTLQELIKMLVNPSSIRTLTFPRDINELVQKLSHNYVTYFDNVSLIPDWISDQLCRAVTGAGFSKRELYTDDEDIIYNFKRCIGFNGINLGATKSDLLDRGLIIELERIAKEKQRKIEDVWAEFEAIKPQLLAYIFDTLVKVLQVKASGGIASEIKGLPRMADFAEIGEIISRCMGNPKDAFINAYYRNIKLQTEEAISANLLGNIMIQFMQDKAEWTGTATELHMDLQEKAATLNINIHDKSWPKSANSLSRKLNLIKTNLREIGIELDKCYLDENKKSRGIKICKISSEPSEPSETQNHAQVTSDISDDIENGLRIISTGNNKVSSEKTSESRAQNRISVDTDDTYDILHISHGQNHDVANTSNSNPTWIAASSSDVMIPKSLYKLKGTKGVWKCHNCFQNGDLQSMIDHLEHCSHDKDLEI